MKRTKLLKFRVPIFTEEYAVNVLIGTKDDVRKALVAYTQYAPRTIEHNFNGRGLTYNLYPDKHPIIGVDGDLPIHIAIATLAHEASHALAAIEKYVSMDDKSDEFHAHGIAAIMRTVLATILKPQLKGRR